MSRRCFFVWFRGRVLFASSAMLMRAKSLAHLDRRKDNHDLTQWLGHADARQVFDLPRGLPETSGSPTRRSETA
jgi:hypothetical protein